MSEPRETFLYPVFRFLLALVRGAVWLVGLATLVVIGWLCVAELHTWAIRLTSPLSPWSTTSKGSAWGGSA